MAEQPTNQTENETKRKFNWSALGFSFLILSSLGIQILGQSMLNIGLGWESDPKRLLIRNGLNAISIVLVVFGIIFFIIGEFRKKNPDYIKMLRKIMEIYYSAYKQIIWDLFTEKANRKRKIKQWKNNLISKENALDEKNKKDKVNGEENRRIYYKGTTEEKLNNIYCQEKALLRIQATDDWIKENLDYILVQYDEITYAAIFIGKVKSKEVLPANDFISKNDTWVIFYENIPRIMIGLGISIFLSSLIYDGLEFEQEFFVNSFIVFFSMAWNSYLAINYAKGFCDTRVIGSMMFRYGVTDEYKQFVLTNSIQEPKTEDLKKIITKEEPSPKIEESDADGIPQITVSLPL